MTDVSDRPDVVEISVPADNSFVGVLRSLTAGLASRCDLTLDDIEDLRIAVDEACALLLPHAIPDTPVAGRFSLRPGQMQIIVTVAADAAADADRDSFAWTVLDALASEVDVETVGGELAITLTKRRVDQSEQDLTR